MRVFQTTVLVGFLAAIVSSTCAADILLFDITCDGPEEFYQALDEQGYVPFGGFNFDDLPDFGIQGIEGPIGNWGGGPVPPGFIPSSIYLGTNNQPFGSGCNQTEFITMVAIGPSAGFGNDSNAILANNFPDSFELLTTNHLPGNLRAAMFTTTTMLGSDAVTVSIYDGVCDGFIDWFHNLDAPVEGHTYAVLSTGDDVITRINIYDSNGGGVEGVMGEVLYWRSDIPSTLVDFNVERGVHIGGGIEELLVSDDQYLQTLSGFGNTLDRLHSMVIDIHAVTDVPAPSLLHLGIESRIDNRSGPANLYFYNWITERYELEARLTVHDVDAIDPLFNIDASGLVSESGDIEMRIEHVVFVPFLAFTFDSFFDQIELSVE